jgi:hypothetical protein
MKDRLTLTNVLTSPATSATALHVAVLDHLGLEIYEWDPATLWMEINSALHLELPEQNQDKLQAIIAAVSTDQFYAQTEGFYHIAHALLDGDGGFQVFDPLTLGEALWAIYEVALNRDAEKFSPSILSFIQHLVKQEGQSSAPEAFLKSQGDPEASEDPNSQLDRFLNDRAAKVRGELIQLKGVIPDLPSVESVLTPVLKGK